MTKRYLKNFAPRWIIFFLDILLVSCSFVGSFFLINHYTITLPYLVSFIPSLVINLFISSICMVVFAIYKGIIRYSEIKDIVRIIKFAFLQFSFWMLVLLTDSQSKVIGNITPQILVINLVVVIFFMVVFRLIVKEIYFRAQSRPNSSDRTLIFGAGMMGQITKKVLEQDVKVSTTLVGFIDDSYYKVGKKIEGLPIYNAVGEELIKLIIKCIFFVIF